MVNNLHKEIEYVIDEKFSKTALHKSQELIVYQVDTVIKSFCDANVDGKLHLQINDFPSIRMNLTRCIMFFNMAIEYYMDLQQRYDAEYRAKYKDVVTFKHQSEKDKYYTIRNTHFFQELETLIFIADNCKKTVDRLTDDLNIPIRTLRLFVDGKNACLN